MLESEANICENKDKVSSQFAHLYKSAGEIDQNKRRRELLEEQKRRRETLINSARDIDDLQYDTEEPERQKKKKGFNYKYYKKVMLSEWLVDVPEDFDVSWMMKICPQGKRITVVAYNFKTKAYTRRGKLVNVFQSILPNGSNFDETRKKRLTVLDCIWNKETETFYVLDILVWCNRKLTAYDAEFRFFWLFSRMSDLNEIPSRSKEKFVVISHTICEPLTIREKLEEYPIYENNKPAVDGILFYHKEGNYTAGITPLVGWLKPFMIPEILNIPVSSEYLGQRPENYVSLKYYISQKHNKSDANHEMEVV